jgi:hypothetical protein
MYYASKSAFISPKLMVIDFRIIIFFLAVNVSAFRDVARWILVDYKNIQGETFILICM